MNYQVCQSKSITLKSPETIEEARRKYCNTLMINSSFNKRGTLLKSLAPYNIWNADETSSASQRKYKVLLSNKNNLPLTSKQKIERHITGLFCFNAVGEGLEPFIILPKISSLSRELAELPAFFSAQKSGWITKLLSSKISQYRMRLPSTIAHQPMLLIVDNHSSSFNSFAVEFLYLHNIQLLTLPLHCSHLLQPFDVAAAKCLKSTMNKIKIDKVVMEFANSLPSKVAMARYITVYSIIESWRRVPLQVLKNGFHHSGIFPFNPSIPLSSSYVNLNIIMLSTIIMVYFKVQITID